MFEHRHHDREADEKRQRTDHQQHGNMRHVIP
jgi:hypothetical protein